MLDALGKLQAASVDDIFVVENGTQGPQIPLRQPPKNFSSIGGRVQMKWLCILPPPNVGDTGGGGACGWRSSICCYNDFFWPQAIVRLLRVVLAAVKMVHSHIPPPQFCAEASVSRTRP